MAWATPVVECAFGHAPLATSPSWTDVSAYVLGEIVIKAGRDSEFDNPSTGTLNLTLNNKDRRFDPSHASGAYFGNLKRGVRIRVTASGTTLFTGWIQGWPQTLDHRNAMAYVSVEAVDALGMLAATPLEQVPFHGMMKTLDPKFYYKLNDESLYNPIDSSGNGYHLKMPSGTDLGKWQPESTDEPSGQGSALRAFNGFTPQSFTAPDNGIPNVYTGVSPSRYQVVTFWLKREPRNVSVGGWDSLPAQGDFTVFYNNADCFINQGYYSGALTVKCGSSTYTISGLKTPFDYLWHFMWFVVDRTAGTLKVIVDDGLGSNVATVATTVNHGFFEAPATTSTFFAFGWQHTQPSQALASLSNVAVMQSADAALFDGTAATKLWRASLGLEGQTEAGRVTTILDMARWPTALRQASYEGGYQLWLDSMPNNALAALQGMTRLDGSSVQAERDGKIKFRNKDELLNATRSQTVQAAFSDVAGATYRYVDVQPANDEEFVYNSITLNRENSTRQFVLVDKTSVDAYGPRSIELVDLRTVDDTQAVVFGKWLLGTYATPVARVASLTVDARYSASVLAKVIDLWLGDRITVEVTPLNTGSATTYDQWIESVEHHIDMSERSWVTVYACSPARSATLFVLNSSLLGGARVLA